MNSEFVGFPLVLLTVYPKNLCKVSRSPLSQATSMAWRIARSTRLGVVWNVLATWGYNTFVMALIVCLTTHQRASKSGRITLQIQRLNVGDLLLSLSSRLLLLYGFENMIAKPNSKVKREPNEHFRKFLAVFSVFFHT